MHALVAGTRFRLFFCFSGNWYQVRSNNENRSHKIGVSEMAWIYVYPMEYSRPAPPGGGVLKAITT
jgi:hypothetical protein